MPVVTLVFYTGTKPWDGPLSLYDMLDVSESMKDWLLQATPDYRMNLIDASTALPKYSEKQCLIFVTGQGGGRRQCGGIVD